MSEAQIWHGGNLDEARRTYPRAPEPWIDLSTGINPVPYPLPALAADLFERLPTPQAHRDLEAAAAEAYGAEDAALVVAAPGTQILISLLPSLRPRSRVAVLGPTYAEHAQAWRSAGHEVAMVVSLEEARDRDVVVVVNPNNPDGRFVTRDELRGLADGLHRRGGWLVVDEAFADFDDAESLVPTLPEGTFVLRSFGKTYGLAGIRLGFAVARGRLGAMLRAALGPWSVSGPAIAIGRAALRDGPWRAEAKAARSADARRLDALLAPVAEGAIRGTTLYRLIGTGEAPDLFDHLGQSGIWVRRFQHDPRLLRFGLPGSEPAWSRLEGVLRAWSAKRSKGVPA
jgi:cobalamin biosynthetic protein CobC